MCSLGTPLANKGAKGLPCKMCQGITQTYKNCQNKGINELLTDDETWIYYFEAQQKINNKVWIAKPRNRPVIAKRSQSAKKVLNAVFFNSSGPVLQVAEPS